MNEFLLVKFRRQASGASALLGLLTALVALSACKDEQPCDPGQEAIGTACYPVAAGGSATAGSSSGSQAGEVSSEGGAGDGSGGDAASGNPDATFGTPCQSDAECGGDAPVCATDPLFYCTQLDCKDGETNAGACPDGWSCVLLPPNPSACVNLATAP
ncbi:MAG: hypothetical protein ABUL60_36680 [Myxococcales bacterium]